MSLIINDTLINSNIKTSSQCYVCSDLYNNSNRTKIICSNCNYISCQCCYQKYILSESVPKCMSCFKEMTPLFIRNNITNVFISTKLKTHQQQILFDQELSILPTVQYLVEKEINKEIIDKEIEILNIELLNIQKKISKQLSDRDANDNKMHISKTFIRPCSDTNCRGFLSSQWKCGTCLQWTCQACHCTIGLLKNDTNHICDDNNIKTAALIISDTKPCPKCKVNIYKIDGCDHMWCTQCHLPFSWKTGQITEKTSNPHYYEWLRSNNREIQREDEFMNTNYVVLYNCFIKYKNFRKISDNMAHLYNLLIPEYSYSHENNKNILRVSYLRKKIGRDTFVNRINKFNTKLKINVEYVSVFNFIITAINDINIRINDLDNNMYEFSFMQPHLVTKLDLLYNEYLELFKLANSLLRDISTTHHTVTKQFNNDGAFVKVTNLKI